MRIKNPNYANTALSTKGGSFTGDHLGVFDVPEEVAADLVETAGWSKVSTRSPGGTAAAEKSEEKSEEKDPPVQRSRPVIGGAAKGDAKKADEKTASKAKEAAKAPEATETTPETKESPDEAAKGDAASEKKEG